MSRLPRSLSFTAWLFSFSFGNMLFWTFYQKYSQVILFAVLLSCFIFFQNQIIFLFWSFYFCHGTWFFKNSEKSFFSNFEKVSFRKKRSEIWTRLPQYFLSYQANSKRVWNHSLFTREILSFMLSCKID